MIVLSSNYFTHSCYIVCIICVAVLLPSPATSGTINIHCVLFLSHTHLFNLDGLFELLMQMVAEMVRPENQLVMELSSVASACLLSLVVALGDTSKMLSALTAMLTAPGDLTVQVCSFIVTSLTTNKLL